MSSTRKVALRPSHRQPSLHKDCRGISEINGVVSPPPRLMVKMEKPTLNAFLRSNVSLVARLSHVDLVCVLHYSVERQMKDVITHLTSFPCQILRRRQRVNCSFGPTTIFASADPASWTIGIAQHRRSSLRSARR